jgi:hypothetical protein
MGKRNHKDPCIMTLEEIEADIIYWESFYTRGGRVEGGIDVEGRLEMLTDRLEILSWNEKPTTKPNEKFIAD